MASTDWHLPRVSVQFSPSKNALKLSPTRSVGLPINSVATVNDSSIPSLHRFPTSHAEKLQPQWLGINMRRLSEPFAEEHPGRFENRFVELAEIGSGEFGKVIKVRRKDGDDSAVYAIKKSKQFEGGRHRSAVYSSYFP